jgi:alkylation response protein AidB-like acyl-CoA dehydrogenase
VWSGSFLLRYIHTRLSHRISSQKGSLTVMVDFTLSPEQKTLQIFARNFAQDHLLNAHLLYQDLPTPHERFLSTKSIYEKAVQAGLIQGQIPVPMGGSGGALVNGALMCEECYVVESSASLTIFGTGLGLLPVILFGSSDQQKRLLNPFIRKQGAPLASFVFSQPGGSANWKTSATFTTAHLDGEHYVLNGEKKWATNCAGWDYTGADLQCVVVKIAESFAVIAVTSEDIKNNAHGAYTIIEDIETVGHRAVSGPHIKFTNLRVPAWNRLDHDGIKVVETVFTASAGLVGSFCTGVMRASFERALTFARTEKRGGETFIISHQSVSDILASMKATLEASRYLTWKALHLFETTGNGELCYLAKIFAADHCVQVVYDGMRVIGVDSYSKNHGFDRLLTDSAVFSIFDGGNVGVRRRQVQDLFKSDTYDPLGAMG